MAREPRTNELCGAMTNTADQSRSKIFKKYINFLWNNPFVEIRRYGRSIQNRVTVQVKITHFI